MDKVKEIFKTIVAILIVITIVIAAKEICSGAKNWFNPMSPPTPQPETRSASLEEISIHLYTTDSPPAIGSRVFIQGRVFVVTKLTMQGGREYILNNQRAMDGASLTSPVEEQNGKIVIPLPSISTSGIEYAVFGVEVSPSRQAKH